MNASQASKLLALTEVNQHILEVAVEAHYYGTAEWEFFCECGRPGCHTQVVLTVAEYEELIKAGAAVLADGHRIDERERSRVLREQAQALQAQARHQVRRAQRNLG